MRIVVIGTSTDVGKTAVCAILTKKLNASYWKPVQCGLPTDREWIQSTTGRLCFQDGITLKTPCSPHLAAKKEGVKLVAKDLLLPVSKAPLIIEGTGGLLSPLNENESWVDAALPWEATHWILVHRHYLGSLNHFLLTIAFLREKRIPLAGVIFNGEGDAETEEMLLQRANTRCLGRLSWQKEWSKTVIQNLANQWPPLLG